MHPAGCKFRALYDACSVTNIPRGVLSTRVNPDTSRLRVDEQIRFEYGCVWTWKFLTGKKKLQIQKYLDTWGRFRYIVLQTQGVLTIYKNHTRGNLLHKHKTIQFDAMGEGSAITSKSPKISHLFNIHDSSLGRHVNAFSRERLQIHRYSITKREPFRRENL